MPVAATRSTTTRSRGVPGEEPPGVWRSLDGHLPWETTLREPSRLVQTGSRPTSHRGGHWFDRSIAHPAQRPVVIMQPAVFDLGAGAKCSSRRLSGPRIRIKPLCELAERIAGGGRGNLGVDLRGDRDRAVSQDLHGRARTHVEGGPQGLAGLPGAVHGNPGSLRPGDAAIEAAAEAPRLDRCAMTGGEHQAGIDPRSVSRSVVGSLLLQELSGIEVTSSQMSPSTSPLRRSRARIRTNAAYRDSWSRRVDFRNLRTSSTVHQRCLVEGRSWLGQIVSFKASGSPCPSTGSADPPGLDRSADRMCRIRLETAPHHSVAIQLAAQEAKAWARIGTAGAQKSRSTKGQTSRSHAVPR